MSMSTDKRNPMTRRELHDVVWSTPVRHLAPRFKVSNTWLAKICRECGIPTPPRGYWAKKAAGKRVRPRPLPKKLDPEEVVVFVLTTTDPEPPPPPPTPDDPDVADEPRRAGASALATHRCSRRTPGVCVSYPPAASPCRRRS